MTIMLNALGMRPYIKKFLFDILSAPRTTGRYGRGEIAATETIILPYLFINSSILSDFFFETSMLTISNK